MSSSVERDKVEKLRSGAMRGKWSDVFETYKQERALRTAKITPTGDTVLHLTVSNGVENIVADMVDFLVQEEKSTTQDIESSRNKNIFLGVENDGKDTPLHLAVRMGSAWIYVKIGRADASLIAKRNIDGETPLFLAALYGQRRTFLWLHYLYVKEHEVSSTDFAHNCTRDNRDTILHCAIAEGHFDVAIEIVHLYKDHLKEMMRRNKEGLTPLHLLAAKRSAFKSTEILEVPRLFHPIYWYWKVEEKKQATTFEELENSYYKNDTPPGFRMFRELVIYLSAWLLLILLLIPFVLVRFTFSEFAIEWFPLFITRMKEKHTRCRQIMTKLLEHASDEDMSKVRSISASKQLSDSLRSEELNELEAMAKPPSGTVTIETPLMIAVKNGVVEMVEKILELFPSTIKDVNDEGKNILLLAVEYRQTNVYRFLCKQKWINESVFRKVDKEGNNALHLAARLGVEPDEWYISVEEKINWYKLVENSMPCAGLLGRYNRDMETPEEMFRESHKELLKSQSECDMVYDPE